MKRGAKTHEPEAEGEQAEELRLVAEPESEYMVSAFQSAGYQMHHRVSGHYVQASAKNSENHAIALVLGRLYVYALVKNIPDSTVVGFLTQLHLAGVDVGQPGHYNHVSSAYCGIVACVCLKAKAVEFGTKPTNLLHPSAWRLMRAAMLKKAAWLS